jgi:hypothetical protein
MLKDDSTLPPIRIASSTPFGSDHAAEAYRHFDSAAGQKAGFSLESRAVVGTSWDTNGQITRP